MYLDDQPLAQIDAGSPEVPTYLHPDHLGKPIYGTNSGGTQVWAANSDAFGVGTPSGSRTVNIRMPGQYYDSESGLFYNWNRYYNPATGRYISSDPIGIDGGLNTFLYAEASPVMYVDPEGLQLVIPHPAALACTAAIGLIGTIYNNQCTAPQNQSPPQPTNPMCPGNWFPDTPDGNDSSAVGNASSSGGKPDCKKANKWELLNAGIFDEHEYKKEHRAIPSSRYDICYCKSDGMMRIAPVGMCGKTNNYWN